MPGTTSSSAPRAFTCKPPPHSCQVRVIGRVQVSRVAFDEGHIQGPLADQQTLRIEQENRFGVVPSKSISAQRFLCRRGRRCSDQLAALFIGHGGPSRAGIRGAPVLRVGRMDPQVGDSHYAGYPGQHEPATQPALVFQQERGHRRTGTPQPVIHQFRRSLGGREACSGSKERSVAGIELGNRRTSPVGRNRRRRRTTPKQITGQPQRSLPASGKWIRSRLPPWTNDPHEDGDFPSEPIAQFRQDLPRVIRSADRQQHLEGRSQLTQQERTGSGGSAAGRPID